MTKSDFLKKYPELADDDNISSLKINLLQSYSSHYIAKGDIYVINLLQDYNNTMLTEHRDSQINIILLEQALRKLKTTIIVK